MFLVNCHGDTCMQTRTHACMHAWKHACTHAGMRTWKQAQQQQQHRMNAATPVLQWPSACSCQSLSQGAASTSTPFSVECVVPAAQTADCTCKMQQQRCMQRRPTRHPFPPQQQPQQHPSTPRACIYFIPEYIIRERINQPIHYKTKTDDL